MQIENSEIQQLAESVATAVITALENRGYVGNQKVDTRTAYEKTEELLFRYREFEKMLAEKKQEIAELKANGVQHRSQAIVENTPHSRGTKRTVLPEESVHCAVHTVLESVQRLQQLLDNVDNSLKYLRNDPYYDLLRMLYYDGETQETVALHFKCSQNNINYHKKRLVNELSMYLFSDQIIGELIK